MGGDRCCRAIINGQGDFNPRLRVGGDLLLFQNCIPIPYFNPRLRVGGDTTTVNNNTLAIEFQSTPPRGRRRGGNIFLKRFFYFNPRLRVGGDILHFRLFASLYLDFNPRLRVGGDSKFV